MQSHSQQSCLLPIVPRTAAAFPLWTAIESLCRRNCRLRGSPVAVQMRLASSRVKFSAASPNTPDVSTANGTKWWVVSRCAYLDTFTCSACAATTPAPLTAAGRCEGANVSGHVASHTNNFPHCHGRMEHPSGRFPSFYFYLHISTFTGSFKDINVNLVKVASCSCVHSFLHGCLQVRKWNIKFGMGMCRFGMEHCAQRKRLGGTANWLLVAVRTLVAVSRAYLSRLPCPARSWRGSTYLDCPALLTHGEGLPI